MIGRWRWTTVLYSCAISGGPGPQLDLQQAVMSADINSAESVAVLDAHPEIDHEPLAVGGDPDVVPRLAMEVVRTYRVFLRGA